MAYIYEFAFLCENLLKAKKIQNYFTYSIDDGIHKCKINDLDCRLFVKSHNIINGDEESDPNLNWVSIIPFNEETKQIK